VKSKIFQHLFFILGILYWAFCSHYHVVITEILTDWMDTPYGRFLPREYVYEFSAFLFFVTLLFILYKSIKGTSRIKTLLYWFFVFLSVVLSYRFLITVPIEIVHFPQYALLSIILAYSLDREKNKFLILKILFIVTILGILDEFYQYVYLTKKSSHYLDFNDFFLNQVGASIGILIYYGFSREPKIDENIKKFTIPIKTLLIVIVGITIIFSLLSSNINFRATHEIEPGGFSEKDGKTIFYLERIPEKFGNWVLDDKETGYFYILDPILGILFLLCYGLLFGTYDRRFYYSFIEVIMKQNIPIIKKE